MNQIVITVNKSAVKEAIKTIEDLQDNADKLSEDSTNVELKDAYHNHGISHGYIRCLKDLELISGSDYSRLFMRQIKISEKIEKLQEKSSSKTAI